MSRYSLHTVGSDGQPLYVGEVSDLEFDFRTETKPLLDYGSTFVTLTGTITQTNWGVMWRMFRNRELRSMSYREFRQNRREP